METIPHYIDEKPIVPIHGVHNSMNDYGLRIGRIQRVYPVSDSGNLSKTVVEYDVLANVPDQHGSYGLRTYSHAVVSNRLAGFADREVVTMRAMQGGDFFGVNGKTPALGYGSYVLLECINGDSKYPVIIGGYYNYQQNAGTLPDGPLYDWRFNGIEINVNKDGELLITRAGPTKDDDTPVDTNDKNVGATVTLTKDGSFKVATGGQGQDVQSVSLDQTNKKMTVIAGSSGIDISTQGPVNVTSKAAVTVNATNVNVNKAAEPWVKGKTYIQAEMQLWQALLPVVQAVATGVTALANACTVAPLTPIGSGLQPIGVQLNNAVAAINQFISQQQTYLSQKHGFSD